MRAPLVQPLREAPRASCAFALVDVAEELGRTPLERAQARYRAAVARCDELALYRAPPAEEVYAWAGWARARAIAGEELVAAGEELLQVVASHASPP